MVQVSFQNRLVLLSKLWATLEKNSIMKRRQFNKLGAAGLAGSALLPYLSEDQPMLKPKALPLKKGSRVGLIAPAFRVTEEMLETAKSNMVSLGFEPFHSSRVLERFGAFGGTDEHRLAELHQMFADESVDAIWTVNGGYGVTRLLDKIDFGLIKKNPKPIIGFSDITALLNAINQNTGLPCFHAPTAAFDIGIEYTRKHLVPLFGIKEPYVVSLCDEHIEKAKNDDLYEYKVIKPGRAKAPLIGGNLSLIAATMGTPFQFNARNKLLFLEDVSEAPYRIDRMLTQMKSAGFFKGVKGIIIGVCWGCKNPAGDTLSFDLYTVLKDRLADLNIPIVTGFSFGHTKETCTFPLGAEAELDTEAATVTLFEDGYG